MSSSPTANVARRRRRPSQEDQRLMEIPQPECTQLRSVGCGASMVASTASFSAMDSRRSYVSLLPSRAQASRAASRSDAHRHSEGPQSLYLCSAVLRLFRDPRGSGAESSLLAFFNPGTVSSRRRVSLPSIPVSRPRSPSLMYMNLLQGCKRQPLDAIFFPMFDVLTTPLDGCVAHRALARRARPLQKRLRQPSPVR